MNVFVGPLQGTDLPEADRIFRVAFGTFLGLPNPIEFAGNADYVGTRWTADPVGGFRGLSRQRSRRFQLCHKMG
jgi:hypothetical protein